MKCYQTSKDYKRLKELLDEGRQVIVFWYNGEIAEMNKGDNSWPGWSWGARYALNGTEHSRVIYGDEFEDFERQCHYYCIEFIEPTGKN